MHVSDRSSCGVRIVLLNGLRCNNLSHLQAESTHTSQKLHAAAGNASLAKKIIKPSTVYYSVLLGQTALVTWSHGLCHLSLKALRIFRPNQDDPDCWGAGFTACGLQTRKHHNARCCSAQTWKIPFPIDAGVTLRSEPKKGNIMTSTLTS